jgi:hypothetical protein
MVCYFPEECFCLIAMFAANADHQNCEEQQQIIMRVVYLKMHILSLTPVLSPPLSSCAVIPTLSDFSPYNLLGTTIPALQVPTAKG